MEKKKMGEFVTFVPGINPTRAETRFGTSDIIYYDQASFDRDFNKEDSDSIEHFSRLINEDICLDAGDVVISNSLQLATIVGEGNAGRVPSLNFIKVEFHNEGLDKYYFIYLFNTYSGIKRQKERELQGLGPVMRIPLKALSQMMIPIIPLEQQQQIGQVYKETLKLQSKLKHYTDLMEQFVYSVLEENLKEER